MNAQTGPTQHSIFGPSKASQWLRCPGSVAMQLGEPDSSSAASRWGTAAHRLAAEVLTGKIKEPDEQLGEDYGEGDYVVEVDLEMCELVETYVANVYEFTTVADVFEIEHEVDISDVVGIPDQKGTADVIIIEGDELQVHDLKTGRGHFVPVKENDQLRLYALGALQEYGSDYDIKRIRLVIHQIRFTEKPQEWDCSVEELLEFGAYVKKQAKLGANALKLAPEDVQRFAHIVPGETQCQWCRAAHKCRKYAKRVEEISGADFEDLTQTELPEPGEVLALHLQMDKVPMIEQWCRQIRGAVERMLLDRQPVEGYKLVKGKAGPRRWSDAEEAAKAMKSMRIPQGEMYSQVLITPPAAEKLLKKKKQTTRWNKLQEYVTQQPGGPSVAPASDPREEYQLERSDDFNNLDEEPLA